MRQVGAFARSQDSTNKESLQLDLEELVQAA